MTVSNNFLRLGVLAVLVGVSLGMWMGATQNFALRPVHAHLNLIGWASMMLYGLVYRVFPAAGEGWMPRAHFALSAIGLVIMMPSLALVLLGNLQFAPVLILSEVLVLASLILFAIILFRATGGKATPLAA